jgi:hypothetical protein
MVVEIGAAAFAVRAHEAEIERPFLLEVAALFRGEHGDEQILHIVGRERRGAAGGDASVDAEDDRRFGYQDEVGGAAIGGKSEELFK